MHSLVQNDMPKRSFVKAVQQGKSYNKRVKKVMTRRNEIRATALKAMREEIKAEASKRAEERLEKSGLRSWAQQAHKEELKKALKKVKVENASKWKIEALSQLVDEMEVAHDEEEKDTLKNIVALCQDDPEDDSEYHMFHETHAVLVQPLSKSFGPSGTPWSLGSGQ